MDAYFTQLLGQFLMNKAREQQRVSGTFQAARNLRKQGVPLNLACRILLGPKAIRREGSTELFIL